MKFTDHLKKSETPIKDPANNSGGTAAKAKAILLNKLSKYINFEQEPARVSPSDESSPSSARKEQLLDNLKQFLKYLEQKKIINITEVV